MSSQKDRSARSTREWVRAGVLVVVAVIVTLLAVLNTETVTVNWIVGSGMAPLIVVVVVSFLLGVVGCYLVERIRSRRD